MINILSVSWDSDNTIVTVTFSETVDASGFANGWLQCEGYGATTDWIDAPTPDTARFHVDTNFNIGSPYSMNGPQPPITFPQNGTVT